ncbi:D-glycero-beta-D-manno-heptose-7-phosphate kinase [Brevibacterium daeguense]|uniref:D-glycero-beta-D-manno-heptose 1-phosphate adenylyltransferase n=1 Tax=Brevibacterium daeguense TaxID=909936 RepID=A0ABP8EKE2_9MICO|nr:D-glycero-beta-D-manno-heptose 1-phosphate adenylyltransferase [Brevibacterium daeguense]
MTAPESLSSAEGLQPELPVRLAELAPVVTVIGDVILDSWIYGTSERLAREAPAPVIDQTHEVFVPGGAANTAMNLAALGARVRIVGPVGCDEPGERLRGLLTDAGVDTRFLFAHPAATTTVKSRIVVGDQVMFRLDRAAADHAPEVLEQFAATALEAVAGSAALIVCDYGGALHFTDLPARLAARRNRPLTVVDAHDPHHWAAVRPDLATPNAGEAERLLGRNLGAGADRVTAVAEHAQTLRESTGAAHPIITLDRDGSVLLDETGVAHRTWANPATEKQASGAGDTFVAALTLARAASLPLTTAADFAQSAADVVVHRLGTSLCTTQDLVDHLSGFYDALVPTEQLLAAVAERRAAGQRIVLTNGCFDVLHRGHTSYLNKAKQLGDVLIVAVNDDDSARRLKGPDRPINPLQDRAGVLAALSCVDYVTAFSTDTPIPLISALRPDIYVKGGDYTPEMLEETAAVEACGGQVRIMEYVSDHSTTSVVQRMQARASAAPDAAGAPVGPSHASPALGDHDARA